jgi:PAS domain S-box-containing protein
MATQAGAPLPYSEEWWRVALSSIGDGVIVTDAAGTVAFMNPVAESPTNWSNVEAKGRTVSEIFAIVNESTRAAVENPVTKVIASGVAAQLANHTVLLARDGAQIFIDDSAVPIKGENGEVFGVVLVFRDISEKKRAEQARLQLASIIESSNDAILTENADGIILTWNKGAEEIYGYRAAEIIGQPSTVLVPADRMKEIALIQNRTRLGERIEHFETVRRRKDGTLIDISVTVSPIRDAEGRTVGVSKVARDITARNRAERERANLAAIVTSSDDAINPADTGAFA